MNIVRVLISIVVVFVLYGLIEVSGMYAFHHDVVQMTVDKAEPVFGPTNHTAAMIGHLLQTVVMVWVYFRFVASNDAGPALWFGGAFGVYLAGSEIVYSAVLHYPTNALITMCLVHIVASVVAGFALSKLYKAA